MQELKLNIGCGREYLHGYKNIDISANVGADEVYDINTGIREDNEVVTEIVAGCVLEQVEDLGRTINECWRVLIKGGILKGYVPSTDPRVLHLDPKDRYFFQVDSFKYFVESERAWQQFGFNYGYKPWALCEAKVNDNGIIHFTLKK